MPQETSGAGWQEPAATLAWVANGADEAERRKWGEVLLAHPWLRSLQPLQGEALRQWTATAEAWRAVLEDVRERHGGAHRYADWRPHPKQALVWYSPAKQKVVSACNRWGKTDLAAAYDVFQVTGLPPLWFLHPSRIPYLHHLPWPRGKQPWRWIVAGADAGARDEGVAAYIRQMLPEEWIIEHRHDQKRRSSFIRVGGDGRVWGEFIFLAQDQNTKAAMSMQVNGFNEDEEFADIKGEIFRDELNARTTDRCGHSVHTFTAVSSAERGGQSKIVNEVIKPAQLGKLNPLEYLVVQGEIDDNTFLSPEARAEHKRKYLDPVTGRPGWQYRLRVLGEIVGANVSPVIDPHALSIQRERFSRAPAAVGRLVDGASWRSNHEQGYVVAALPVADRLSRSLIRFEPDAHGTLELYEPPKPGHHYTIGCDVGTGTVGNNPSAAAVFNRTTGEFVALLHGLIGPSLLQRQLAVLGTWYNRAWLCVEWQHAGTSVVGWLMGEDLEGQQRYPSMYVHTRPGTGGDVAHKRFGYPMGVAEQAHMISVTNAALRAEDPRDPAAVPVRCPISRVLIEWGSFRRDDQTQKMEIPSVPEGDMTTHGDAGIAASLALVAHASPTCPLPFEAPTRPANPDPMTELAIQYAERIAKENARKQARERGEFMDDEGAWSIDLWDGDDEDSTDPAVAVTYI